MNMIYLMKRVVAGIVAVMIWTISPIISVAQAPPVQWQRTYGGNADELLFDIKETADGGFVAVGRSSSGANGDKTEALRGGSDIWVLKMDAMGNKQWDKTIGASANDHPASIMQANDGGFIIGGFVSGAGGDRTAPIKGTVDYWLLKLNATGTSIQWQQSYGGSATNQGYACIAARGGGYYLGGFSNSGISGDKSESSRGVFDKWIVRTDAAGIISWNKTVGGNDWEAALTATEALDGGILTAGYSRSGISGDKTEANRGGNGDDYWIVKIDGAGNLQWDKTLGGSGTDQPYTLQQTADTGYIIGGFSNSPISGDKAEPSRGLYDFWLLKLDTARNIVWQKTLGGSGDDQLFSVTQTADGGYIIGGSSASGISGERTEASNGGADYWFLKLDALGVVQWQKAFGGSNDDHLRVIRPTTDGGYILGGYSNSPRSGGKTEDDRGGSDFWIIKLVPCDTIVAVSDSFCINGTYRRPGRAVVAHPGTYYDTLTNTWGCDSVIVTTLHHFTDDMYARVAGILGSDTMLCEGDAYVLHATLSGASDYSWSTGAITPDITVTQTGTYRVVVTSVNGCIGSDTVNITFQTVPVVDLGRDTGICDTEAPLMLYSQQPPGVRCLWSNGLSDTIMAVTRTGTYWMQANVGNCTSADTIRVTVTPAPNVYLGEDTVICTQFPLRLGVDIPEATYVWSTGELTAHIQVRESGSYTLDLHLNGCTVRDTIIITAIPVPEIYLGADDDICHGTTMLLDATYAPGSTYVWNTGATTAVVSVTDPGIYWVEVISADQCIGSDSILLRYHPLPFVSLGTDTVVCEETPLRLSPNKANVTSLRWHDGSTEQTWDVTRAGTYIVTGINKCGEFSDTITVTQLFCDIWLPNAFTPNGDGVNDVLRVLGNLGRLEGFTLSIYNRWGERLFHSSDKYMGWDGTHKGSAAQLGTYVYVLQYHIGGAPVLLKGSFHLLR